MSILHRWMLGLWMAILGASAWTVACRDPSPTQTVPDAGSAKDDRVSGQGDYRFRVKYRAGHLPQAAQWPLGGIHAGFAVDRRPGRGEVYFGVAGAGIVQLSADLTQSRLIPTNSALMKHALHNTTLSSAPDGTARLIFPSPDSGEVFTTELDGTLVETLKRPPGDFPFADSRVAEYFAAGGAFMPTDVAILDETTFVPTGYSDLDAVLTARIRSRNPFEMEWTPLTFGGRGEAPAEFWTAHGITVEPDGETLSVTDRLHSEIDRFTPQGDYIGSIPFPKGSQPCDIDYAYGIAVVGCLVGPEEDRGAPIYILKDDRIVSTVLPKDELGLEKFVHVHDAVLTRVGERLYIIALAWMPGDFVILEQVID